MAPRSAKTKKAADVKVAENDAPKKGRGKAKNVPEVEPEADIELNEKVAPVTDKKPKRGKKAASDSGEPQVTDKSEEVGPPAKKGRKKNVDDTPPADKQAANGDQSGDEELSVQTEENEQSDDGEANGHTEEAPSAGRGRKKQAKKAPAAKKAEPKTGRGRKAKQATPESEDSPKEEVEKPKPAAKGRGRKAAKVEVEPEADKSDTTEEEVKEKPAPKGRKKAPAKVQEKEPELDADEDDLKEEEKPEPKKKEPKGRKNQGKKAQPKEDIDDDADEDETPSSKKRKVTKKADAKNDDDEEVAEAKPAKGKRGQKKVVEPTTESEEEAQDNEPTSKRRRKGADDKAPAGDSKKKAPPKNKALTDFESLDFSNKSTNSQGKDWNFKISSWNVDGIRAWATKGGLDYFKYEKPDILCVQETKCSQDKLPSEIANVPGYHAYWVEGEKDGYAGVGIYTTKLAMNVVYGLQNEELDSEGRIITAEYEQFYLVCTYVPNAGRKLVTLPKRLQWNEEFRRHVKELDKKKPVIICGDMNVSHKEIDLANPKTNRKNAGFTDEEREGMTELLGEGFVDTYRHLYPDKTGAYTFWTYMMNSRAKNVGWRLDYFIISERLLPALCDNVIRDGVYGSDHCPLSLFLHLSTADKPKE
ncbi:DNA-(apurinic or apyrimidinic site) endonuclease [Helicoverpa zea]|uniref:DNA-(apurinic or apyrimidinic site) endonuclease n=1 Tax=Helicoverpa zea TaxID=7113 RepID=UPI001F571612|nr:DNA-(apurinic or apyrimidinic site) endonuclease [Helicoverpa zea]